MQAVSVFRSLFCNCNKNNVTSISLSFISNKFCRHVTIQRPMASKIRYPNILNKEKSLKLQTRGKQYITGKERIPIIKEKLNISERYISFNTNEHV